MIKIHRILASAVIQGLDDIFNQGRQADKVIEWLLKQNRKWGARDRGFVAEHVYDIVRWKRRLQEAVQCADTQTPALWKMLAVELVSRGYQLPDWKEFLAIDWEHVEGVMNGQQPFVIRESIPDWLDERGRKELGADWEREMHALNEPAALVIRVNTLKTNRQQLQRRLETENVATTIPEGLPDALVVTRRVNLFGLASFREGLFDVQDGGSQRIAPYLCVAPGMRVIDACAGAGGKSLHLAALMKNKGQLISMDISERKLEELSRRARRAGISNTETRAITSGKVIKRLSESADRLLLDVPCSGSGVLRRNPDAKWKLSNMFIDELQQKQREILDQYCTMVKPEGLLLYATCSIFQSENEIQVKHFLTRHPEFTLLEQERISVSSGYDGFFMALMKKM